MACWLSQDPCPLAKMVAAAQPEPRAIPRAGWVVLLLGTGRGFILGTSAGPLPVDGLRSLNSDY